ncbi:MAG: hypothetical protein RMN52_15740 [Anaerolineae bacterium]|nr:hypothetical protein [Candidatus Roseilinea sp.]MDW8451451.1 hypothetical protein [Anaerolineae bacterium]
MPSFYKEDCVQMTQDAGRMTYRMSHFSEAGGAESRRGVSPAG